MIAVVVLLIGIIFVMIVDRICECIEKTSKENQKKGEEK